MNRLVIIGNGFDKAHGLPTSYSDFIDAFWGNVSNVLFYQNKIATTSLSILIKNKLTNKSNLNGLLLLVLGT
jgi:Bacteriophage abortive infection AbiH